MTLLESLGSFVGALLIISTVVGLAVAAGRAVGWLADVISGGAGR